MQYRMRNQLCLHRKLWADWMVRDKASYFCRKPHCEIWVISRLWMGIGECNLSLDLQQLNAKALPFPLVLDCRVLSIFVNFKAELLVVSCDVFN